MSNKLTSSLVSSSSGSFSDLNVYNPYTSAINTAKVLPNTIAVDSNGQPYNLYNSLMTQMNPYKEKQHNYIWQQLHNKDLPLLDDNECATLLDYLKSTDKESVKLAFSLLNNKQLPENFEVQIKVWNAIDKYIGILFENQ